MIVEFYFGRLKAKIFVFSNILVSFLRDFFDTVTQRRRSNFCLGFHSQTFLIHRTSGEREGYFCNSSLPLPPISHTRRHQPGNYCRELTSAHSQQSDWNCEPLVSNCKSLTSFNFKVSFFMYIFSGALYDNCFTDMAFLKERFTESIYTSCCDIANIVFLQTSHIRVSMLQLFC